MVEPGQHFRFALETRQALAIACHRFWQHLDGNGPFQVGVRRPVDLTHATLTNQVGDFIGAETGAGG